MSDKPFFSLKFAFKFLVCRPELLIFNLNLVEELLNPHKVIHIIFELRFLKLRERFFHHCELSFKLPVGSLKVTKMLITLTLWMAWGAWMFHISLLSFPKTLYGSILIVSLVRISLLMGCPCLKRLIGDSRGLKHIINVFDVLKTEH